MYKTFKYEIIPSGEQKIFLSKQFGCCRFIWNYILSSIGTNNLTKGDINSYYHKWSGRHLTKLIPGIKNSHPFLNEVSSVALQQKILDLGDSIYGFVSKKGVQKPKLKKKHGIQSVRLMANAFTLKDNQLYIAKCKEPIKVLWSRPLPCRPLRATITFGSDGRYSICFLCEVNPQPSKRPSGVIGIDLGLTYFATLSTGEKIPNPRFIKQSLPRLRRAQRKLSKTCAGSKNREKARLKVAKLHRSIVDARNDFHHKLARQLINKNHVIAVENLTVAHLVKNRKLSRHISDVGWKSFLTKLTEKTIESQHSVLVYCDKWFPSTQLCSNCGYLPTKENKLSLGVRSWICPVCSTTHDRDINAAINLKNSASRIDPTKTPGGVVLI
jgi:putative transposase